MIKRYTQIYVDFTYYQPGEGFELRKIHWMGQQRGPKSLQWDEVLGREAAGQPARRSGE